MRELAIGEPVIRMAPNPRRRTSMSPPTAKVVFVIVIRCYRAVREHTHLPRTARQVGRDVGALRPAPRRARPVTPPAAVTSCGWSHGPLLEVGLGLPRSSASR